MMILKTRYMMGYKPWNQPPWINVEGSHGPVHQYNRMALRSCMKSRDNLAEAKSLNSTLVGNVKSNQPKEGDLTRGEPGPKVEQTFLKGDCLDRSSY